MEIYYVNNYESLRLVVSKNKKSYFAHWSVTVIQKDGKIKRVGKKKWLGRFHIPLDEIKEKSEEVLMIGKKPVQLWMVVLQLVD